jgi:hypothetical protein
MIYHYTRIKRCTIVLFLGLLFILITGFGYMGKSPMLPSTGIAYGVNVDMSALVPGTPYTIRTATGGDFFALAAQLGINTFRITDFRWESTGEEYPRAIWQQVFAKAEAYHMHIILLLMDGHGHMAIEQAHLLLDQYGLAHAPALWIVDLYNEPDVSDPMRIAALRAEAAYVRQVAPEIPITIGGWKSRVAGHPGEFRWQDPADIPQFINLVDIVSPHLYQFAQGALLGFTPQQWTRRYLGAVRKEAEHKPILLEEFGASNGLAPTSESGLAGSPEWQASVYQGVLEEVTIEHDQGVLGAVAWMIAPRPGWSDPAIVEGDMTGWAFVLDHGRRLLPAAGTFLAVRNGEGSAVMSSQQDAPSGL